MIKTLFKNRALRFMQQSVQSDCTDRIIRYAGTVTEKVGGDPVAKDSDSLFIDFAALRTMRVVFDQTSFSKAAELLGVNQSTISYTIDRFLEPSALQTF